MALPLPRVVADVGPGGPLVTAMGGINSLHNDMILRKINEIKAQYAPVTAQAEAASKLAYANLMGPQFLAKIMGNDSALANLSEDQKNNALNMIYKAGTGGGSGNAMINNVASSSNDDMPSYSGIGQPSTNSLSGWITNKLKNAFGNNNQQNSHGMPSPGNNLNQDNTLSIPRQDLTPYQAPDEIPNGNNDATWKALEAWKRSPEGQIATAHKGDNYMPDEADLMQWWNKQQGRKPTYAENTGAYKGLTAEGEETGKIRAKDIQQLNDSVFNSETNQTTLNDISDILASPEFAQIRNTPLAGHHELAYYAKEGNPAQQDMIGRYYTLTGSLIKDASRDFAGQFRQGEQQLLNSMKPTASDTVDLAKGKIQALSVLNQMLAARSRLTSKLMSEAHINKLEASEQADKLIDGDDIRKEVKDRLNPTVTIFNRKTGEKKTISVAEARKLGVPNV